MPFPVTLRSHRASPDERAIASQAVTAHVHAPFVSAIHGFGLEGLFPALSWQWEPISTDILWGLLLSCFQQDLDQRDDCCEE